MTSLRSTPVRRLIPAVAVSASLLVPAGAAAQTDPSPQRAQAAAVSAKVPSGYRKATAAERKAMNRAKGVGLTRRFGWYRGKIDPKYGFICGYRDGAKFGVGVIRKNGAWRVWRNAPSGDMQRYALYCAS